MSFLRFLLLSTAGWMNRYQQRILEYIIEENRVRREQLDGRLSLPETRSALCKGGCDRFEIELSDPSALRQRPDPGSLGRWKSCAT
jgi:hypothetical protein